jgi:hypothetical protein
MCWKLDAASGALVPSELSRERRLHRNRIDKELMKFMKNLQYSFFLDTSHL